jgi:DNA-binding transcriptional LysR family regulator
LCFPTTQQHYQGHMDIDQLKTFLEVCRQKSFSRAAEKIHVTQPSISAQIRSLETYLGHRLLERGGGKVTLTAAGRVFEPFAENCLSRLNHMVMTLADLERLPRGALTVSANDSTALYVLPVFFSKFRKQYPRVALNIVRAERTKSLELVLDREVEFGVVSLPLKDKRLHVEVIHTDEFVLVVPPNHPLAGFETVSLKQIAQHRLLLLKQGRRRGHLDELFAQEKLCPRIAMELDSNELLKRLILKEMGIGFLPKINVVDEERNGSLKIIPIENVNISRELALISRKDQVLTRAGNAFFTFATGTVRSTPEDM